MTMSINKQSKEGRKEGRGKRRKRKEGPGPGRILTLCCKCERKASKCVCPAPFYDHRPCVCASVSNLVRLCLFSEQREAKGTDRQTETRLLFSKGSTHTHNRERERVKFTLYSKKRAHFQFKFDHSLSIIFFVKVCA